MPAGQVIVAELPAHARSRARHGVSTLARVIAHDDRAGRFVETCHLVLASTLEAG